MSQCWSCQVIILSSGDFCRSCGQRVRWHTWNIVRELGAGGSGTAYLVEQAGQRAVLKIPLATTSAREHQIECRNLYLAAALGVAAAPLETAPDGLLMEYLPTPTGMSVRERARNFLGAVNRLHNRELVHRDLKPENIIGWHLIDLGAMVDLVRDDHVPPIGTPGYAAPEAYRRHISPQLDAYAAACVIITWLGGPEPDATHTIHAQGFPTGWTPPHDPTVDWHQLLTDMLEPNPQKRLSVGQAYHRLTGEWCTLENGTRVASDLVSVKQWRATLPDAPCREVLGYATNLPASDIQRYLTATNTRLPTPAELEEVAEGTRRQPCLRPPERILREGLISDLGARHCRRFLWQPTSTNWLWGGTAYADQESISQPSSPNAMAGLRVVHA